MLKKKDVNTTPPAATPAGDEDPLRVRRLQNLRRAQEAGLIGVGPTKYDPIYCEALVHFSAETGHSLMAFAGAIGVSKNTMANWQRDHPDFKDAVERSASARVMRLEEEASASSDATRVNYRLKALARASAEDWGDKATIVHEGGEKPVRMDVNISPAEAYARMVKGGGA